MIYKNKKSYHLEGVLVMFGRQRTKGVVPELFSDNRLLYAPAFYHGSSSFVQYLAENYDVKILLTGISSFKQEQETIERLTGKTLEILKKE